jgi:hypothetical protein
LRIIFSLQAGGGGLSRKTETRDAKWTNYDT